MHTHVPLYTSIKQWQRCTSCDTHLPACACVLADGAAGGSLFGNYTAPKPGSLFAAPAFGAARQSDAGNNDAAEGEEADGEGNEVFGGDSTQPVVQLSEVPKQTGEEDEETVFAGKGVNTV